MGARRQDLLAILILAVLALAFFWPVTVGGKTLLPADNLFAFEPWRSFAAQWNAARPHNELLSDLILENYAWKGFIRDALSAGRAPLWNPYLFAGAPFLAAGQHSALYPFSVLFYVLPLAAAYGWFSALQMLLAGLSMYVLARTLGANRLGSLIAGAAYMLSGFFVVSVVFSMVIAAAAWLPLLLACVERIVQRNAERPAGGRRSAIPWMALGALTLGVQFLAGHVEISIYSLLVSAAYALFRLLLLAWRDRQPRMALRAAGQLAGMVALGVGLGAIQWLPLYELVSQSFRQGSASYADIIGWAYPKKQLITFLIPDFFGNPSHHGYWDIISRQWTALTQNALGGPAQSTFWGQKNYVEAGSYVGALTLLLALVAVIGRRDRYVAFFGGLAGVSLLFAFGTPLYAVLYYGLPGMNQLHSPFRWVFPYTVSAAALAGLGASALSGRLRQTTAGEALGRLAWLPRGLGWAAMAAGGALLAVLVVSLAAPAPFVQLGQRVLDASEPARLAFADGRAFYSYQFRNLLIFGLALFGAGAVLRLSLCPIYLPRRLGGYAVWKPLALLVLTLELWVIGAGFNPATDPALLTFKPPAVAWLQARRAEGPFRFTTYNLPGDKTFNANAGMFYGLEDVRGYDSIITRQYVEFMDAIAPQENELLYNRIAPLYAPAEAALGSRLLDLLGVRYVMTEQAIARPDYKLVYDGEVRIYENAGVLPRAFFVAQAEVLPRAELLRRLPAFEPTERVLLEQAPTPADAAALAGRAAGAPYRPADAVRPTPNEVFVDITAESAGWLVLADSYFPGWKAYVRPLGGADESEVERAIYRADGNFRAVRVDAGAQTIRFVYSPLSLKLALFVSFLAGVLLFLVVGFYAWGKLYREERGESGTVRRVAKNSLTPMLLSLLNKGIDFAFAMLRLRILAPAGEGSYAFAITFIGYFEILTLFGLGTLLTREVSKDKSAANRYLSNALALRAGIWLLSLPLMGAVLFIYYRFSSLSREVAATIGLFALALFFSQISDALSAVFYAHERMEYPAGLSSVTSVLKVGLGTLALLLGWGFVGLAGVSVLVNIITAATLFVLVSRLFFRPRLEVEPAFQRQMLKTSYPLMINHLLATLFFRVDMLLLKPLRGDAVVGYYSAAYKYIDGLNIIPSYFTLAIFPLMSRFAASARDSLMQAYILSLRLLLMISLPIAALTPFIANELILILGGARFLPDSRIALQLLIWFLPISYVNGVTQYVLIAIDQQRFLTRAFLIGLAFNLTANLLFIPRYGYQAAAVITVLSELVLLGPFYYCVRRHLGAVPWLRILWPPALAAGVMAAGLWLTRPFSLLLRLPLAAVVYLGVLVLAGGFGGEEMALLRRALPAGRLARLWERLPGA
jgi:O-antigen/teichoic acid export membrane protein